MQHKSKAQAQTIVLNEQCTLYEYDTHDNSASNMSQADITGRYPTTGWVRNTDCDERVYIIAGSGALLLRHKLATPPLMAEKTQALHTADTVFIPKGEYFAWQGDNLQLCIFCTPAWTPEQYEVIDK